MCSSPLLEPSKMPSLMSSQVVKFIQSAQFENRQYPWFCLSSEEVENSFKSSMTTADFNFAVFIPFPLLNSDPCYYGFSLILLPNSRLLIQQLSTYRCYSDSLHSVCIKLNYLYYFPQLVHCWPLNLFAFVFVFYFLLMIFLNSQTMCYIIFFI